MNIDKKDAEKRILKKGKKLTQRSFVKAVESGSIKLVELYLAAGFDIDAPDNNDITPIMAAVACEKEDMVDFLIDHGACVEDPALFLIGVYGSAFSDSTRIIDALANAGAPLDAIDEETGLNACELVKDMGNDNIANYLRSNYSF